MNLLQLVGAVDIGLITALITIGTYITFRIIDFPDLTVDGSYTLGAAVAAALIAAGHNPWAATAAAMVAGMMAGMVTGYLNVRWNILGLLAGILTMTALYSINLRVMQKPNIAIMDSQTVFGIGAGSGMVILMTALIVIALILLLSWFFTSDFGLAMRSVGINPRLSNAYGISVGGMKIFALCFSNGIVALGGALFAQSQGFADASMGTGTVIAGLASLIVGEAVFFHPKRIVLALFACVVGSILYKFAITLALNADGFGLEASDLQLITALIVTATMILPKLRKR